MYLLAKYFERLPPELREAAELLDRNSAFFAGGEIPQEDKDAFFEAIMTAYVTAKEEARRKFTPRSLRPPEDDA